MLRSQHPPTKGKFVVAGALAALGCAVAWVGRRAFGPEVSSTPKPDPPKNDPGSSNRQMAPAIAHPSEPLQPTEGFSPLFRREFTPIGLLLVGLAAIAATLVAHDVTWRAIWIGVASTTVTGGLVDGSALMEARRRERAVLRAAGDRVGAARSMFFLIIDAMFGGAEHIGFSASALREVREPVSIDLDEDAHVMPPRSRRVQVIYLTDQLTDALHEALRLGSQTSEAPRFEEIDSGMRRNGFVLYLHSVIAQGLQFDPLPPRYVHSAADALDLLDKHLRFFQRIAGASWQYGSAETGS